MAALLGLVLLSACALPAPPQPTPLPTPEWLRDAGLVEVRDPALPWPLQVPDGFSIALYARDLGEVRSVTFSPNGIPYVTIMNRRERDAGQVVALPDDNGDGRADRAVVVADGIDRAHGIVFHDGKLYAAAVGAIFELVDTNGDLVAEQKVPVVTGIPAAGDHWARPIAFDGQGRIVVGVGSTCNLCQEDDPLRATILRYTPNAAAPAGQPDVVARGLRSVVDIKFRPGSDELWAVNNGPDHLGSDEPPDQLFKIAEGSHYGWPYCIGDRVPDLQAADQPDIVTPDGSPREVFCRDKVAAPARTLPPHVAPLGMTFYEGAMFPAQMRGDLFVALHGSYAYLNTNGYRVIRIPMQNGMPGVPENFVSGWTPPGATRWQGRPVDVEVAPDGSLFITDDFNGFLYRVTYTGTAARVQP